jgi:hypothetical protein
VPSGKGTTFTSPWSVVSSTTGSISKLVCSRSGARPSALWALIVASASSSRWRFSGGVDGVRSSLSVISSQPSLTRANAADQDVGDALLLERGEHRLGIEPRLRAQPRHQVPEAGSPSMASRRSCGLSSSLPLRRSSTVSSGSLRMRERSNAGANSARAAAELGSGRAHADSVVAARLTDEAEPRCEPPGLRPRALK